MTVNATAYFAPSYKLRKNIKSRLRGILSGGVILLHDNTRPHVALAGQVLLLQFYQEVLENPLYSLDLSSCEYHTFGPLQKALKGRRFAGQNEIQDVIKNWFQHRNFFHQEKTKNPQSHIQVHNLAAISTAHWMDNGDNDACDTPLKFKGRAQSKQVNFGYRSSGYGQDFVTNGKRVRVLGPLKTWVNGADALMSSSSLEGGCSKL
ncbi:mariner Mos1 transposase [Trichonephila clavipes]|nr:mariner Mos1 transposase [Trichonephila clavipes]